MALNLPKGVKPLWDFVVQVAVGSLAFMALLILAGLVAGLTRFIAYMGHSPSWFENTAHTAEKWLFFTDLFAFSLFMISEIAKLIRSLWHDWKEGRVI